MEAEQPAVLTMYHPDLNATGDTTQRGFDDIYAARGWVLLGPAEAAATSLLARPVWDLSDLTVVELDRVLNSFGASAPSDVKKPELVKLVKATAGGQAPEAVEPAEPAPADSGTTAEDKAAEPKPSGAAKATAK